MTRADLEAQRAELARQEQEHLARASEARGAMKLIDYWLTQLPADVPAPTPEAPDDHL